MTDRVLYKKIVGRIGFALLLHVVLMYVPSYVGILWLEPLWERSLDPVAAYVVTELYNGAVYLAAFMIPALFFYWISRDLPTEKMPLAPRVPKNAPLWILGGMAAILSCAILNSLMMSVFNYSDFSNDVLWNNDVSANYQVVLMFVTMALIPAICEEFLFRGMIQTNLMPFGRTTALIGSAVLFGLMHANAEQFLYATCAGIVLGIIREKTGSIWCGTLLHLFNNLSSVIETVMLQRIPGDVGEAVVIAFQGVIMAAGVVSIVILVLREKKPTPDFSHGTYGQSLPTAPGRAERALPRGDALRLFLLRPTILAFATYAIGRAVLFIVEAVMYSAML